MRADLAFMLAAVIAASPASACIMPADPGEAARMQGEQISRDREKQADLVPKLAVDADTIVIATSLREMDRSLASKFLILRVIKGRAKSGASVKYQASPSIPALDCTMPSELFRNTATESGKTYLLYVRGNRLLRAIRSSRSTADIPENEELALIAKALASPGR
ncbi:MAG TPA: hypothetical protein VF033_13500 [Steroidobacteraceae bacterium]